MIMNIATSSITQNSGLLMREEHSVLFEVTSQTNPKTRQKSFFISAVNNGVLSCFMLLSSMMALNIIHISTSK